MKKTAKLSRVFTLILCLAICLSMLPVSFAFAVDEWENPFTDVNESDWFYEAARYMNILKVFQGTSATEFSPNGTMTRGMFVTALGRLSGVDAADYSDSGFEDVVPTDYYSPYTAWARDNDYVNGTSETMFSPNFAITREMLATILYRYIDSYLNVDGEDTQQEAFDLPYLDSDEINTWAVKGVSLMFMSNIMEGDDALDSEYFRPGEAATRAEVADALWRLDVLLKQNVGPNASAVVLRFLELLTTGDFDGAGACLSEELTAAIEPMGGIQAFIDNTGELYSITGLTGPTEQAGYQVFSMVVTAESGEFNLVIYVNENGLIDGINLSPLAAVEDPIAMPSGFSEFEITVDAGEGYPLEGRAVLPDDTSELVPIVILVQGSGATDYDEIVGANRIFGQIARGLAERGIATLRYSKRNFAYPEIMDEKGYSIYEEYVRDVLAAVELAKQQPGADPDRVYILGHSQGGMLAPLFLDEGADVAGMILLAGTPRSLMDVVADQQKMVMDYYTGLGMTDEVEEYNQLQKEWIAQRLALESMTAEEALDAGTVYEFPAFYMYILEQYDAIATIKKLEAPTLILQGANDMQVSRASDFSIYENEVGDEFYVETILYDGLSHVFLPSTASNLMEAVAEYNVPAEIPGYVFDDIAGWILAVG